MKLAGFGLYRYDLPFTEPLALKGAALRRREGLLLRLTGDDGSEGWGEAAPLPGFSREGREVVENLLRKMGKTLLGREVSPGWTDHTLHLPHLAPSARFALDLASRNLLLDAGGKTILETMQSRPAERVWLNGLLSGSSEEVLADARRMRDAGYSAVKLKVGRQTVREDAELVQNVSDVLGDGVSLRLDANRTWSYEAAVDFTRAVRDARIEYIEEPLADTEMLPRFVDETGVSVALDESLVGMKPENLSGHAYARAVMLKPTLLGGISRTLRMSEEAHSLGMTPVISSAYETGVGTLGLISLAATIGKAPAGLDTYRRLAGDVLHPPLDLGTPSIDVREVLNTQRRVDVGSLDSVVSL